MSCPTSHSAAHRGFSELAEPLEDLLSILEGCPGKQKGRSHTAGHCILMEFQAWQKKHPQVTLSSLSEQQAMTLQQRALFLLPDQQLSFLDSLIDVYQLKSADVALLQQHLVRLQSLNLYKEAAMLSMKLQCQKELDLEEMCVPLILQNKLSLAESFVTGHSHLEERLVTLLDSWCHPSFCLGDIRRYGSSRMLVKYSGLQKASQWSLKYSVPRDQLPSEREKFYQVPLTEDKIVFVDTPEALLQCQKVVLKEGALVGVDMEWQPTFGCSSTQQVALMQLAVMDQVFLLDISTEGFSQHSNTVSFIRSLFSSKNVLKLGYSMSGDLRCVLATWPQFSEEPLVTQSVLDLVHVHQKVTLFNTVKSTGLKLAQKRCWLVKILLRKASVCWSSRSWGGLWTRRNRCPTGKDVHCEPVKSDMQKTIITGHKLSLRLVADAYCLLEVYRVLESNPAHFGLPDDLRDISPRQSEKRKDKKPKERHTEQECQRAQRVSRPHCDKEKDLLCGVQPSADSPPLPPQQLRVVCDNMLQGLGRTLRCLGVDVLMLENGDDHRVAAKVSQAEGRVILTCGQPFLTLRSQVGEGRCLSLDCSEKAKDQAVRVLRHFNVQPTPSDIFSRCQVMKC
ncbi:unnamed protein product, partial [Tetraodon nigroviridis]